ncbi:hypothetical protein BOTBODRAFT_59028 [Botryobasidium botryosum FD-172 SS1]|uniref:Uncharacterized protein n=1 Tax=Botryobasidium botryosum (strain FD-172 SS1) TaxID=930990 RepID=A0A067MBL5_BOTB1|nr:hypothetical protein BOTBODRAFT_59028 [Botryobasidium botryosum FD-172 SS1]
MAHSSQHSPIDAAVNGHSNSLIKRARSFVDTNGGTMKDKSPDVATQIKLYVLAKRDGLVHSPTSEFHPEPDSNLEMSGCASAASSNSRKQGVRFTHLHEPTPLSSTSLSDGAPLTHGSRLLRNARLFWKWTNPDAPVEGDDHADLAEQVTKYVLAKRSKQGTQPPPKLRRRALASAEITPFEAELARLLQSFEAPPGSHFVARKVTKRSSLKLGCENETEEPSSKRRRA